MKHLKTLLCVVVAMGFLATPLVAADAATFVVSGSVTRMELREDVSPGHAPIPLEAYIFLSVDDGVGVYDIPVKCPSVAHCWPKTEWLGCAEHTLDQNSDPFDSDILVTNMYCSCEVAGRQAFITGVIQDHPDPATHYGAHLIGTSMVVAVSDDERPLCE